MSQNSVKKKATIELSRKDFRRMKMEKKKAKGNAVASVWG